mmetsp:Transcript_8095/g.21167  ORF Transcript_8095/g.21167 Transcript_8095/m.21167 type:complete len:80 (-) Transcript_8095:64-303(-)
MELIGSPCAVAGAAWACLVQGRRSLGRALLMPFSLVCFRSLTVTPRASSDAETVPLDGWKRRRAYTASCVTPQSVHVFV